MEKIYKEKARFNYTGYGWEGVNYQSGLSTKDIAERIREQLKKEFPQCKFSVRCKFFSGGSEISVSLQEAPFEVFNKEHKQDKNGNVYTERNWQYSQLNDITLLNYTWEDTEGYCNGAYLTKEAWQVLKKVSQIIASYRFDDSDGQIDYFHTNFYPFLTIGRWDKPFKVVKKEDKPNNGNGKATKRQLWALFCITGQDWRNKDISFEEAKKLIAELTREDREKQQKILEAIREGIKEGLKEYEKVKEPAVAIYETEGLTNKPKDNGKIYIEPSFSGCGWVYLRTWDTELVKHLKRLGKHQKGEKSWTHKLFNLSKSYYTGYYISLGKTYDNGHIERLKAYYEAVAKRLRSLGYEVYAEDRLD